MPTKVVSHPKKAAPASNKEPSADLKGAVTIDFPTEGETIAAGHYAIRISGESGADVEVTVDGKNWNPTRQSIGYYWFDWWTTHNGESKIKARLRFGKGRWKESDERRCLVRASII